MGFFTFKQIKEVFQDYKKSALLICCKSCNRGCKGCQNEDIKKEKNVVWENKKIIEFFNDNVITESIIFGGLEPFEQFEELYTFIEELRETDENTMVIIYTGFSKEELKKEIELLKKHKNIIIKFGNFIEKGKKLYDEVLGVELASDNQYAEQIS